MVQAGQRLLVCFAAGSILSFCLCHATAAAPCHQDIHYALLSCHSRMRPRGEVVAAADQGTYTHAPGQHSGTLRACSASHMPMYGGAAGFTTATMMLLSSADHHALHNLLQCATHLPEAGALAPCHQLPVLWQPWCADVLLLQAAGLSIMFCLGSMLMPTPPQQHLTQKRNRSIPGRPC